MRKLNPEKLLLAVKKGYGKIALTPFAHAAGVSTTTIQRWLRDDYLAADTIAAIENHLKGEN